MNNVILTADNLLKKKYYKREKQVEMKDEINECWEADNKKHHLPHVWCI